MMCATVYLNDSRQMRRLQNVLMRHGAYPYTRTGDYVTIPLWAVAAAESVPGVVLINGSQREQDAS